jgi:membrane protease YdiL (CAAX protease family)
LTGAAGAALALLIALAWASQRQAAAVTRSILTTLAIALAFAVALHRIPGFSNILILDRIRLTPDAAPYTLYANFDKGAAGAVLLAFFAPRIRSKRELGALLPPLVVGVALTSIGVFAAALGIGYVRVEPKIPDFTLAFLITNLLFVCVAEEAFFRGFLQERMTRLFEGRDRHWRLLPIAISAVLFGVAHAAGGPRLVLLAMLAGLGYSWAYVHARKIEVAILVHFFVNVVQFFLLTYPNLQK